MSAQPQETGTFTSAREFFDAAREAKPDQKRAEELLEQIESEQPHGSGLGAHVRSSPRADAMAAIVARRMDRAERLRLRIEADSAIIDAAGIILWGAGWDGFAGVASILGDEYADVMDHYYIGHHTWTEVGYLVHWSPSLCRRMRDKALRIVDDYGIDRILEGTGIVPPEWQHFRRKR